MVLATRRISDDAAGLTVLVTLLTEHTGGGEFVPVEVAIETGRGLLVTGLRAAGHRLFEINPKAVSRYRDRHAVSGAKSDPGDALVLAHLLRTDGHRHRPMPADSEQVAVVGVLARDLAKDTLRRYRRVSGNAHLDTLEAASNFALVLSALGEHQRARDLTEYILARRRQVLGNDHPDTLRAANNLAANLRALNEHEQSRHLKELDQSSTRSLT